MQPAIEPERGAGERAVAGRRGTSVDQQDGGFAARDESIGRRFGDGQEPAPPHAEVRNRELRGARPQRALVGDRFDGAPDRRAGPGHAGVILGGQPAGRFVVAIAFRDDEHRGEAPECREQDDERNPAQNALSLASGDAVAGRTRAGRNHRGVERRPAPRRPRRGRAGGGRGRAGSRSPHRRSPGHQPQRRRGRHRGHRGVALHQTDGVRAGGRRCRGGRTRSSTG